MLQTLEAVIDEDGTVHLLEQIDRIGARRALVTILEPEITGGQPRPYGLCAGEFVVPDDFNVQLPESILALFESS